MPKVKLDLEFPSVKSADTDHSITVKQREAPFTLLPKAIFRLRRSEKKRYSLFRLLLLTSYLYSLSMTDDRRALTSVRELMKVLSTNSHETIVELLGVLERSGIIVSRRYDSQRKRTEIILANYTEIPEVATNWDNRKEVRDDLYFKFPKLITILPISAQAKSVYLYLCALRKRPKEWIVTTTISDAQKILNLRRNVTVSSFKELEEKNLIRLLGRSKSGSTYEIVRPISEEGKLSWSKELIQATVFSFPSHPFSDYFISYLDEPFQYGTSRPFQYGTDGNCSNMEPVSFQYGTDKEDDCSNMEPISFQYGTATSGETLRNTTTSPSPIEDIVEDLKEVEDFIEDDDIYNGGGDEKENNDFETLENKEERITTENSTKVKANEENNGSSLSRPNGLKNSKAGAPKNSPAGVETGGRSSAFAVSEEKLRAVERRVKRLIAELPDYVLSRYPYTDDWKSLEKVYSPEVAEFLAKAYQFLKAKTGNFANIRNEVGFIISFVASDSGADFEEFIGKFLSFAGYKHLKETIREAEAEETQIEENSNSLQEQEKEQEKQKEVEQREVEAKEEDARKENTAEGKPKPKKAKKGELVKLILDATEANSLPRSVRKRLNEYLGKAKGLGWADPYSKKCYYVLEEEVAEKVIEEFSAFVTIEVKENPSDENIRQQEKRYRELSTQFYGHSH